MSSKKKAAFSTCEQCKCTMLPKDVMRHVDICGSAPHYWEMSVVKAKCLMKGFVTQCDKWEDYLPPDTSGWLRTHSVFLHPQSVWPCKELGIMKIFLTAENAPYEELITLTPIWNPTKVQRISFNISPPDIIVNDSMRSYIQIYLTNAYIQPGVAIPLRYYGKAIEVIPELPLDLALKNVSLEDGELACEPVLFVETNCSVMFNAIIDQPSDVDLLSSINCIGGMHTAKKTLIDFILMPFLNGDSCCSVLLWGLPGSGKTFLLTAVAASLKGSGFYCQSMDEFNEKFALIPSGCVVILDWPAFAAIILAVRQAEDLELGVRVRFPVEVEVDVPMEEERIEILRTLIDVEHDVIAELARRTHGFTGGDLKSLVISSRFVEGQSIAERLENARKRVRPTGIRHFILEVPHVTWSDIGGSEELKLEIQQAVIWPQRHRAAFDRFGIDPPSGILLYGPPGCSKTLVARALANESKMNFLAVKGPELFSKWVGESEKAIRDLFSRARQVAPTIVFFDEIDAVGGSRGSEKSSGVTDRVLAQLLTELDGLEKQSGVLLLAATNRPDQLDSALLRPGRLDRAIYVGLPDAETRRAIIEIRTKRMVLSEDDVTKLVNHTKGYSGAELVAVCRQAALLAMRENIDATEVRWNHFEEALTAIVPRTDTKMLDVYEKFKRGVL
ncbi:hypothetical protein Q1695_009059 [Nippostrongylus brasiliensis]|nr:hypothetical protein Q1695_009059 [Nippostrongylus brasiliensis]